MFEKYFEQLMPIVFADDDNPVFWHDVTIDVIELIYNHPTFGPLFHDKPVEFVQIMKQVLDVCQDKLLAQMKEGVSYSEKEGSVKKHIDVRLMNVPPIQDVLCRNIRDISSSKVGKLVIIFGTVMRTGNVNSRELKKKFKCKACGFETIAESDITECN